MNNRRFLKFSLVMLLVVTACRSRSADSENDSSASNGQGGASGQAGFYFPSLLLGGGLWTCAWILFAILYSRMLFEQRL